MPDIIHREFYKQTIGACSTNQVDSTWTCSKLLPNLIVRIIGGETI